MQGYPPQTIKYGKRICHFVNRYKRREDAKVKANSLRRQGIVAVVKPWYTWWRVYRCGQYKR